MKPASQRPNVKNIDEYISLFPESTQKLLKQIRKVIGESAPEANEAIAYAMPTYKLNGRNLVHFAGYKKHIGFYPTPFPIEKFEKELARYKTSKGTVQFPLDEPLPVDLIKRMVKFRVQTIS